MVSHKNYKFISSSETPSLTLSVLNLYYSDVTKVGKVKTVMNVFLLMGVMQCMEIVKMNLISAFVKTDGLDLIAIVLNVQQVSWCNMKIIETYDLFYCCRTDKSCYRNDFDSHYYRM